MTEMTFWNLAAWAAQVGLIALAAALLTGIVHVDAPAVRYAWWRAVLLTCLALPVIQPWHPPSSLPAPASVTVPGSLDGAVALGDARTIRGARAESDGATAMAWPSIVGLGLAAGGLARIGWIAAGLLRLRRLRRAGVRLDLVDVPEFGPEFDSEGAEVRYVTSLRQPVTFGTRRPVVLLPEVLRTMPPGVQRAVLAHELWHVRRGDWLWSLGEETMCALLWFHPAIRYVVSRVQTAREEVVDELAILSTNERRTYLEALLAFADEPRAFPAAPFARRRHLFNRMLLISAEAMMSSRKIVAASAGMAGVLIATGWYGALAFPLTAVKSVEGTAPAAQAQPRDPRPGASRAEGAREQALIAATTADPSNVTNWLELARLQEQRDATGDAERTYQSAMTATRGAREVLEAMAGFFTRTGQFERAIDTLEDMERKNPDDPSGPQRVAVHYFEKAQKDPSLVPIERLSYIDAGIAATDRALRLRSDYVEALTYKNILLRMKANIELDASQRDRLIAEADALRARAIQLGRQRNATGVPDGTRLAAPPPPPPPPPPTRRYDYEVNGQMAVRVGGEIAPPAKIRNVPAVYPHEARAAGVSGVVVLEALIDAEGAVQSAQVLRSIPLLDDAALAAVRQWKYVPTLKNGVATPVVMTVTVNFTLL